MMKKYYSTLAFCLLFTSCFSPPSAQRKLASTTSADCSEGLRDFLGTDADNTLASRRKRTALIQENVRKGDFRRVVELMAESHDNGSSDYKAGMLLKGRNAKRENRIRKLRRDTEASYVPALFQRNKSGHDDVFSTIFYAADGRSGVTSAEKEAFDDITKWCDEYEGYWNNITEVTLRGTEAKRIANYIEEKLSEGIKFPIELQIPFLKRDGSKYSEGKIFNTREELDLFYDSKIAEHNRSFSMGKRDDRNRKADTYDEFYNQAVRFRKLELVYKRLNSVGSESLEPSQKELLTRIRKLLEERPELRPRSLEVAKLQKKEYWAEWRAKWRFWRSRAIKDKYPLPESVKDFRDKVSPTGIFVRYAGLFSITTITGSITGEINLLEKFPRVQYMLALLRNYRKDFVLATLGSTNELDACAKSERLWSFKEVNSNAFLLSHYSRFLYKARFSDYDLQNEDLRAKKKEKLALCIKKKDEYNYALHHEETVELLPDAHRMALDGYLMELIAESSSEETVDTIEEILFLSNSDEPEEADLVISELARSNETLANDLRDYLAIVDSVSQKLPTLGPASKYESAEDFIKAVESQN